MIKVIRSLLTSWSPLRLALLVGILCSVALISPVSAASTTPSPSVIIAVDATTHSCVLTRGQVVGSSHAHKVLSQSTCAAGTFMKTQIVPLAQAQAKHEAYVLVPTLQASATQQLQFTTQVQQMVNAKRQAVQAVSPLVLHPNSDCGETFYGSAGDTVDGDRLFMEVEWHVSSSCSSILIDTVWLQAESLSAPLWWADSEYAGSSWATSCPSVGTGNLSQTLDKNESMGYDLVYHLLTVSCPGFGFNFTNYYPSYGPLS